MLKSLSVGVVALAGAGLVAVAPAAAATTAPSGAGYIATPKALHTAAVTVDVPSVSCGAKSKPRIVRLGLFATATQHSRTLPVSLFVRARCASGQSTYLVEYRGTGRATTHVHRGDRIELKLQGAYGFEIDNLTTGQGQGGGSSGSATLNPAVLVGAETGDRAPNGVTAMFRHARANGVALPKVHHRRVGRTAHVLVSRFNHEKDFAVLFR